MKRFNIILMIVLIFFVIGCASDDSVDSPLSAESDKTDMATDNETAEPEVVVEEDDDEEMDDNDNLCKVGDMLMPGDSCIDPGTGELFEVLEDGRGKFGFATVGKGINLNGNINGKFHSFAADRIEGDTWEIKKVTPE